MKRQRSEKGKVESLYYAIYYAIYYVDQEGCVDQAESRRQRAEVSLLPTIQGLRHPANYRRFDADQDLMSYEFLISYRLCINPEILK